MAQHSGGNITSAPYRYLDERQALADLLADGALLITRLPKDRQPAAWQALRELAEKLTR